MVTALLWHCPRCNLYQATTEQFIQIRYQYEGYFTVGFRPKHKPKHKQILSEILESASHAPSVYVKSEKAALNKKQFNKQTTTSMTLKPKSSELQFSPFELYLCSVKFDCCPFCKVRLYVRTIEIPVDQYQIVNINIKTCRRHFFSFQPYEINKILNGNNFAQFITVNRQFYFDRPYRYTTIFHSSESNQYMIVGKHSDGKVEVALIFGSDETHSIYKGVLYLNYESLAARKILTTVFHDKCDSFQFDNQLVQIAAIYTGRDWVTSYCPNNIIEYLSIRKNGGYVFIDPRYKLVHALLYSEKTKCYEIANVSYDTEQCYYFIDFRNYKEFVSKYGRATVSFVSPFRDDSYSHHYANFNPESTLHECGYNVNSNNKMNDSDRQMILAEIINLGIMHPSDIIGFLESLYNRRKAANMDTARSKWKRDIDFVKKYKTNTKSFIIADI